MVEFERRELLEEMEEKFGRPVRKKVGYYLARGMEPEEAIEEAKKQLGVSSPTSSSNPGPEQDPLKEALILLSPLGPLHVIGKLMKRGRPPVPPPMLPIYRDKLEEALEALQEHDSECGLCQEEIGEIKQKLQFIGAAERATKQASSPEEMEELLREEYRRIVEESVGGGASGPG